MRFAILVAFAMVAAFVAFVYAQPSYLTALHGNKPPSYLTALQGNRPPSYLKAIQSNKPPSYLTALQSNKPTSHLTALRSNKSTSHLTALQSNKPPLPIMRLRSDPTPYRLRYKVIRYNNNGRRGVSLRRGISAEGVGKSCRRDYHVDYLQLTLMWGPGFCATSPRACVVKPENQFSVHGLWPQLKGEESPAFCCFDNTFDYRQIEPIVPILRRYWFSYFSEDSRSFWSHEWVKHGTCLRDVQSLQGETRFFGTTLDLMKRLPLLESLKKSGVVPNSSKPYESTQIINSLRSLTNGSRIKIDCDYEHHQSIPVLTGLAICLDTNMAFVDCPQSKRQCQQQVYFRD